MKPRLGRVLLNALRVLLIAAGVGFIVWKVEWGDDPETGRLGMVSLVRSADVGWLVGGLLLSSLVFPLQAVRWWMLMRCRGMNVSLRSTFKLVMVGLFFNFCVPIGANGGDVAKAYGAARGIKAPGSTAKAVVSVLMDRVAGLAGMILLAGLAGLLIWDDPVGRRITVFAWAAMGGLVIGGTAYVWPVTRKWLGVTTLTRLNMFRKIDEAVTGYRHHPAAAAGSVAISLPVHLSFMIATSMAGYAVGVPTPWATLVAVLPVVMLVGALPLTFLGIGLMEPTLFGLLESRSAVTFNQVTAMLMAYRAYLLIYAMFGGLLVLVKGVRLHETPTETGD
ncbi:MAG: lysylphosphatidylglycerol synthase transmembrane domain-containing protein [Planctomycetota bacterium]